MPRACLIQADITKSGCWGRYSYGLTIDDRAAEGLLEEAIESRPNLVRAKRQDGNVVVGSVINALIYQVLLIQLLPEVHATQETHEEKMRAMSDQIFGLNSSFRQSVAGSLGVAKTEMCWEVAG